MRPSHSVRSKILAISNIIFRNTFILINGIIFAVVILLIVFGDIQEGIFLGLITVLNIIIGIVQETRAWLMLEKLQLLAAPKIIKIAPDNTESIIFIEDINVNDKISLKIGDQVPCDGHLVSSHSLEVSEALITGESKAYFRESGDKVFAGSIITSGSGVMKAEKTFAESRIAKMTESIKKYSLNQSPIQKALSAIIKYTGYILLVIIAFVVVRGYAIDEPVLNIVQNIGALTSALLPQGMLVITTLLFAFGAAHLYQRSILLQEINAMEKMGRIKNLCIDKTGTLTDNNLTVEQMYSTPGIGDEFSKRAVLAYIKGTGERSQTILAIKKSQAGEYDGNIIDNVSFSSSRQFGAVHIKDGRTDSVILAGAPDIFLPYIIKKSEQEWLRKFIDNEGKIGKRLLCFVKSSADVLPHNLSGIKLSGICLFILNNNLREGVIDTINYFQDRGVQIKVVSGDNLETVKAIAAKANIKNTEAAITGPELESWSELNFIENIRNYTVFARIKPEQKEKIIKALKYDGYTAMIGDGANDALAIKSADLGIAVFDGAQATRQIASVILIKNSFSDLPGGVKLAENIIENIEIYASVFFNQVFMAFFFFILLTIFGYSFPFTPLNMTFISYFSIGLPGFLIFYWIVRPTHSHVLKEQGSFLGRVLPFSFISAIPAALIAVVAFYSTVVNREISEPTSLVVLLFIILDIIFFMNTPKVFSGPTTKAQKNEFILLVIVEIIAVFILINIPLLAEFYDVKATSLHSLIEILPFICIYGVFQYVLSKRFFIKKLIKPTKAEFYMR